MNTVSGKPRPAWPYKARQLVHIQAYTYTKLTGPDGVSDSSHPATTKPSVKRSFALFLNYCSAAKLLQQRCNSSLQMLKHLRTLASPVCCCSAAATLVQRCKPKKLENFLAALQILLISIKQVSRCCKSSLLRQRCSNTLSALQTKDQDFPCSCWKSHCFPLNKCFGAAVCALLPAMYK